MNRIYYDSGTTNTRAYLFEGTHMIHRLSRQVGSRDCALSGSNACLLQGLKNMYDSLLRDTGLDESQISQIWMSGMISSATGILEIPHLSVPVDLRKIRSGVVGYYEPYYFHRSLNIIPGVKTDLPDGPASYETFTKINNMRGEETEIFGILAEYPGLMENSVLILPGSHTQIAIVQNGAIVNILSTVTGELYNAIANHTILSSSLTSQKPAQIIPEMVSKGLRALKEYGFNRALYTVRTMDLFLPSSPEERHSYFEGILNGGVVTAICSYIDTASLPRIAVYGSVSNILVFETLFHEQNRNLPFIGIEASELPYSARGFLCISSQSA